MKCKEVMTPDPECCSVSDAAMDAARMMKNEDVGLLPVIDLAKQLAGTVTDRDLCLSVVAEGKDPQKVKVVECMTGETITCRADDDIQTAERLMKKHQVRRIPVVDENNVCIGIISQADIALKVGRPHDLEEVVRNISKPAGTGDGFGSSKKRPAWRQPE